MHDPHTVIGHFPPTAWTGPSRLSKQPKTILQWVFSMGWPWVTLWHHDPEKDGSDDSCGWFPRSRHGDKAVLARITKRMADDWDNVYEPSREDHDEEDGEFKPRVYFRGFFDPFGNPVMSVQGIVANLFFIVALEFFGSREKAAAFCQTNLFEIMLFAENPTDSLRDGIVQAFGDDGYAQATGSRRDRMRQDRIELMASCIYAWILRKERPWYKHPRWHVHHWSFQIHLWQLLRRRILTRCRVCGKPFGFFETPVSDCWDAPKKQWFRGEAHLRHSRCQCSEQVEKYGAAHT